MFRHTSTFHIIKWLGYEFSILGSDVFYVRFLPDKKPHIPSAFQLPATKITVVDFHAANGFARDIHVTTVGIRIDKPRLVWSVIVGLRRPNCETACITCDSCAYGNIPRLFVVSLYDGIPDTAIRFLVCDLETAIIASG